MRKRAFSMGQASFLGYWHLRGHVSLVELFCAVRVYRRHHSTNHIAGSARHSGDAFRQIPSLEQSRRHFALCRRVGCHNDDFGYAYDLAGHRPQHVRGLEYLGRLLATPYHSASCSTHEACARAAAHNMTHAIEPRDAAFALVLHRFLARFAHTAVSAFVWIILFLYFADIEPSLIHAVIRTFLLYALAQTVTILAAPFALRAIGGNMLRGLYRAFYRAPYELEHRAVAPQSQPLFTVELFLGFTPFLAGLAVAMGIWYPYLLFVAALINALALIPLLFTLTVYETYSWNYRQAFAELIAAKNQPLAVSGVLAGAGGALLFLIWPILLYFELSPQPLVLGAAFSEHE